MSVVPEGGMAFWWNLNQIIDGHTTIEHALPMAPLYRDVIQLFSQSGTAWTPSTTFLVFLFFFVLCYVADNVFAQLSS